MFLHDLYTQQTLGVATIGTVMYCSILKLECRGNSTNTYFQTCIITKIEYPMYEFRKNLCLQTVLIDSAEVHRMKYAFFMKVRKQKCVIMAKMIDQAFDMRQNKLSLSYLTHFLQLSRCQKIYLIRFLFDFFWKSGF